MQEQDVIKQKEEAAAVAEATIEELGITTGQLEPSSMARSNTTRRSRLVIGSS